MTRRWIAVPLSLACALSAATCYMFQQPDVVNFSHSLHKEQGAECVDCHGDMTQVVDMKESRLPKMEKCMDCHDDKKTECAMCHTNPDKPQPLPRLRTGSLVFNHKNHAERTQNDCSRCHKKVVEATAPANQEMPQMLEECMSCHRKDFRNIECVKCHTGLIDRKQKPMRLFSHQGEFLEKHPIIAKGDSLVCNHCHRQAFCADCHNRMAPMKPSLRRSDEVDRQLIHRGDWITNHPIQARMDPKQCLTCHRQSFCNGCHEDRGVAARGGVGLGPHPGGWMTRGNNDFHGTAARNDIVTCAACHDRGAQTNCITCHRVGGGGGNPHPAGWSSRIDKSRGRACVMCHQ